MSSLLSLERSTAVIQADRLQDLLNALWDAGYHVIGPQARDGAVVCDEVRAVTDLAVGVSDVQEPARCRLKRRGERAIFGVLPGARSWKEFLHPPMLRLWRATREGGRFELAPEPYNTPRFAFLGIRACDIHAIDSMDRVFLAGPYKDPAYAARREGLLIVAVQCSRAGGTCFCDSMGTGPRITEGADLTLTEVLDGRQHTFVVEVGSERGAAILAEVPHEPADEKQARAPEEAAAGVRSQLTRSVDMEGLHDLLVNNHDHPYWDDVASRCTNCGNCTMVCPTCFCTTVSDETDLPGLHTERWRKWDSCHTMEFSYIYGGSVRYSPKSRYRQWLTHKFASWQDQFGVPGCVGCGRCITWCPVGLDATREIRALRHRAPDAMETSHGDT